MNTLEFDLTKLGRKFKPLNATNGGPVHVRKPGFRDRDNFIAYKEARIPYTRNHDSGVIMNYGGPYSHDISAIFPNFEADENDPSSYDFACTDEDIFVALEAGTKTFFRLGQTIEHQIKKHNVNPPKDFLKWAKVCEHIIRHYNEGWANGFNLNMEYWEIWNEPDGDEIPPDNPTWNGTKEQFYDFYETAAKHLKKCFPNLKIGGPALSYNVNWAADFIAEMKKRNVEIDFFSWHCYGMDVPHVLGRAQKIREALDQNGYTKAESILNEWNYVESWGVGFTKSLETIRNAKGAAYTMACISAAQNSSIDMLMYYDTRPSVWNGAFDFYSLKPLKGYYPLKWYGMFYDFEAEIPCKNQVEDIYTLCGKAKNGKTLTTVTYYTFKEDSTEKEIELSFGKDKKNAKYEIYLLDEQNSGTLVKTTDSLKLVIQPNTIVLIKEI